MPVETTQLTRPRSVTIGLFLLLVGAGIDASTAVMGIGEFADAHWAIILLASLVALAIVFGIWRGVNAARWLVLLLTVSSVVQIPSDLEQPGSAIVMTIATIVGALGAIALFVPASRPWFVRPTAPTMPAQKQQSE